MEEKLVRIWCEENRAEKTEVLQMEFAALKGHPEEAHYGLDLKCCPKASYAELGILEDDNSSTILIR